MARLEEFFADGIGEITLAGGMVRMDLVSLTGKQGEDGNEPRLEASRRIVMPPDGFLRSFGAMENLVKQLVDAGIVKQREGAPPAVASATAPTSDAGGSKSPNF